MDINFPYAFSSVVDRRPETAVPVIGRKSGLTATRRPNVIKAVDDKPPRFRRRKAAFDAIPCVTAGGGLPSSQRDDLVLGTLTQVICEN